MKIHDLIQGSPEWLAYRAQHFNASDAPAMMGCSPYKTRAALLRELHSGVAPEIDTGTHMRFANGHRAEALARPLAERIVGEDLYPITGSDGRFSASFDGLTLDGAIAFEHKALGAELRAAFADMQTIAPEYRERAECRSLPLMHRVQMEQQMLVSGAERTLFMASEWDADGNLVEELHCWYYPDGKLRQQIVDGWAQFERDLAAYEAPAAADPAPTGRAPDTLPALRIEISGAVTASNLAEFKETALSAIRSVNRELTTDQHFADAEKAAKWCSEVESRLAAAKEHALSQTASIDALFRTIDDISAEARRVRLDLDKLVTRRKVEVKEAEVARSRDALELHVLAVNAEIAPARITHAVAFGEAIKGLKTIDSVRAKLDAALAAAKIEVDGKAREIRANLAAFKAAAAGFEFLFADLAQLAHKPADDFRSLVEARIATHKAMAEEAARAAAAQAAASAAAAVPPPSPVVSPQTASVPQSGPIVSAAPAPVPPARAAEPANLNLTAICGRLGFTVSASFLADVLHVQPAKTDKASRLYTERQFATICRQLQNHVGAMAERYAGVPA